MAEYLIPEYCVSTLSKKIKRIINKGAHVIFDILEQDMPIKCQDNAPLPRYIKCAKIKVSSEYKINGWIFVATIEQGFDQNTIKIANNALENDIPSTYKTAAIECEHCCIKRGRNDTYLIYNEHALEWLQIGKTCLQKYTQGMNAETCTALAAIIEEIKTLNTAVTRGTFDLERVPIDAYVEPMDVIRRKAYLYVKNNGYQSGVTGLAFSTAIFKGIDLPEATEAEVEQITDYLENTEISAYIASAWAIWNKKSFAARDGCLITSAIYSYFKNAQKLLQQKVEKQTSINNTEQISTEIIGNEVAFIIKDFRVLYLKNINNTYSSAYPVYKIIDTNGKVYICACHINFKLEKNMQIKGSIKKITEYKKERQIILNQCTLLA